MTGGVMKLDEKEVRRSGSEWSAIAMLVAKVNELEDRVVMLEAHSNYPPTYPAGNGGLTLGEGKHEHR